MEAEPVVVAFCGYKLKDVGAVMDAGAVQVIGSTGLYLVTSPSKNSRGGCRV
jgi:hypothetical protein